MLHRLVSDGKFPKIMAHHLRLWVYKYCVCVCVCVGMMKGSN